MQSLSGLKKKKEETKALSCYPESKISASSKLLTDMCCLYERCGNTTCDGKAHQTIAHCTKEKYANPKDPRCGHLSSDLLTFQNSQSTIKIYLPFCPIMNFNNPIDKLSLCFFQMYFIITTQHLYQIQYY